MAHLYSFPEAIHLTYYPQTKLWINITVFVPLFVSCFVSMMGIVSLCKTIQLSSTTGKVGMKLLKLQAGINYDHHGMVTRELVGCVLRKREGGRGNE